MIRLLYRSIARFEDFHETDRQILCKALEFNAQNGISGFLWRANGQFFQALHGPEAVIDPLMARIAADDRHSDIEVLLRAPTEGASPFDDWAMGYDYMLENLLAVGLTPDGRRPDAAQIDVEQLWSEIVSAAHEQAQFGSVYPFARRPGESPQEYLSRLSAAE